jgi:adenosylcobinamide-phosphate synthase
VSVLVAAALDAAVAEPPERLHPVVWTGCYLDGLARVVPAAPPGPALVAGAAAWSCGAAAALLAGRAMEGAASRLGRPGRVLVRGVALWPLMSARMLLAEVLAVESGLRRDTASGRVALARIVSRDTWELTPEEIRGAAIESLAENLSDSVVAPVFWYLVAGLPGAAVYRFANTADACWGYRTPRWRYAGRVAARADDLLNLGPARITAALLTTPASTRRLRAEARHTDSPNAGWPMAAMALRLDRRLTKRGHYVLNPSGADPADGDVERAARVARRTAVVAVLAAAVAEHLIHRNRGGRS